MYFFSNFSKIIFSYGVDCNLQTDSSQGPIHLKCITRWEDKDGVTITIFFQQTRDGHKTTYLQVGGGKHKKTCVFFSRLLLVGILQAYLPKDLDAPQPSKSNSGLLRSRFIGPCKSWTDARFGITQFVTPNTHICRHPGVQNRKQKKSFRKNCIGNMVSDFWKNC